MNRVLAFTETFIEIVCCVLLCLMVGATAIGVFDRYWLHSGFGWPEEVSRYLFIWVCLLGAVIGAKRNSHYVVDWFTVTFCSRRGDEIFQVFAYAIGVIIMGVITYKGAVLTKIVVDQISAGLQISMAFVYIIIPISSFLIGVIFVVNGIELLKNIPKTK
jgi:TRAP-type transport system small permease protein